MAAAHAQTHAATLAGLTLTGSRSKTTFKLGQEIGSGGNGVVHAVALRPELVAKISRSQLAQHDVDKLQALVLGTTPELLTVAAWPTDCLLDGTGRTVGFVMPRILEARPLYELYGPRTRIQHFPAADFRFLVHVAANVARLFAAVHKAGFICGDVNHSNILIRQNGTVAAVDCDSFQVGDGSRFPCLVGTEGFVPPELLGAALGQTPRTPNHDNYGLALLIFHLLFMGRHPFAGRFLGRGDMPLERAIGECRFAYSRDTKRTELAPPPFTLPMSAMGAAVRELFEQAFHPNARKGSRPLPETWIDALDALQKQLVPCGQVGWHYHPRSMPDCPWCAIEGPTRIKLFGGLIRAPVAGIADLDALWARYLALVEPATPPPLPKPQSFWHTSRPIQKPRVPQLRQPRARLTLSRLVPHLPKLLWLGMVIGWCILHPELSVPMLTYLATRLTDLLTLLAAYVPSLVIGVLWCGFGLLIVSLFGSLRASTVRLVVDVIRLPARLTSFACSLARYRASRQVYYSALAAWREQPPPPDVSDLRSSIEETRKDIDDLNAQRDARLKAVAKPLPVDDQLARHLGQYRIEAARLPNIGPARCAVLRSWGIDTAADIEEARILEIPGFGTALTNTLVSWRRLKEQSFTPNTNPVVDPLELHRIDRELACRRITLMKMLRSRIMETEQRLNDFNRNRASRWAELEAAGKSYERPSW